MAAGSKPKYYLVEASVLPEIFAKVIEAKELLETGQVRTVADAWRAWTSAAARFINTRTSCPRFRTCRAAIS